MELFCTYAEDYKNIVFRHLDRGIIDGNTLLLSEDIVKNSEYFAVTEYEIVCDYLNGVIGDVSCKNVNFSIIKEMVDSTLLSDSAELTVIERYKNYLTTATYATATADFRARNVFFITDGNMLFATTYAFQSYESFLLFVIQLMIKNNCRIYKCQNCGKYFVPKRSDAYYCNNLAPYDDKRTCMQKVNYENSLKSQRDKEEQKLYKQIYNALLNKAKRTQDTVGHREKLDNFLREAADFRNEITKGTKTNEDYIQWLQTVKCKNVSRYAQN